MECIAILLISPFFFFTLDTLSGLLRMISRDYNVIHLRLMGPGVTVISLWDFSTIILGFLVFLDENQKKKKKEKKKNCQCAETAVTVLTLFLAAPFVLLRDVTQCLPMTIMKHLLRQN